MFSFEEGTIIWARLEMDKCAIDGEQDPEFFNRFRKKSFQGDFDTSVYHIGGKDGNYFWDENIYQDAAHGIILRHRGKPIAVTCYGITKPNGDSYSIPDSLEKITDEFPLIVQLQGLEYSGGYLRPIRWEKLLVASVEKIARDSGFKFCGIQPAEKVREMPPGEARHIRYDVTAKRSGYKLQKGLWLKEL